MSDNPLGRIPAYDRVSIPAVLVRDGEDPGPALAAAGIVDPIAIPVVLGENPHALGMLGDGFTPNLIGVLETKRPRARAASPVSQPDRAASQPDAARQAQSFTKPAPPSFGMGSFAPIRGAGATRSGRFGKAPKVFRPRPAHPWRPTGYSPADGGTAIHLPDMVRSAPRTRTG